MNTITFSRQALSEYKKKYLKAIVDGHTCFIWKNSPVTISRAEILLSKFEPRFATSILSEITINHDF